LIGQHGLCHDVAQHLRLIERVPVSVERDVSEGIESQF
jgi:hypothetical protein